MITVFIEYKIDPEKRDEYLHAMQSIPLEIDRLGGRDYRHYEGIEQPNLFVEMCEVDSVAAYEQLKASRLADDQLKQSVIGGAAKIHIWAFQQLGRQGSIG